MYTKITSSKSIEFIIVTYSVGYNFSRSRVGPLLYHGYSLSRTKFVYGQWRRFTLTKIRQQINCIHFKYPRLIFYLLPEITSRRRRCWQRMWCTAVWLIFKLIKYTEILDSEQRMYFFYNNEVFPYFFYLFIFFVNILFDTFFDAQCNSFKSWGKTTKEF